MATNTFRLNKKASQRRGDGLFTFLDKVMSMDDLFKDGVPVKILPHLLFLTLLGVFYIGNRHHAEKNIRKITSLETQVQDLRADYTTLKAGYMLETKQSEVVRKAKKLGLIELAEPLTKIVVTEK